jgi:hypothetical protein
MRSLRRAVTVLVTATALLPLGTGVGQAAITPALGTPVVTCSSWEGQPAFAVTTTFTHRGPAELRVYEYDGAAAVGSEHAWFRGSGEDAFTGYLPAGSGVTFSVHLLKVDHRTRALVDVVPPVTTGAFTCS